MAQAPACLSSAERTGPNRIVGCVSHVASRVSHGSSPDPVLVHPPALCLVGLFPGLATLVAAAQSGPLPVVVAAAAAGPPGHFAEQVPGRWAYEHLRPQLATLVRAEPVKRLEEANMGG